MPLVFGTLLSLNVSAAGMVVQLLEDKKVKLSVYGANLKDYI